MISFNQIYRDSIGPNNVSQADCLTKLVAVSEARAYALRRVLERSHYSRSTLGFNLSMDLLHLSTSLDHVVIIMLSHPSPITLNGRVLGYRDSSTVPTARDRENNPFATLTS